MNTAHHCDPGEWLKLFVLVGLGVAGMDFCTAIAIATILIGTHIESDDVSAAPTSGLNAVLRNASIDFSGSGSCRLPTGRSIVL